MQQRREKAQLERGTHIQEYQRKQQINLFTGIWELFSHHAKSHSAPAERYTLNIQIEQQKFILWYLFNRSLKGI